MKPSCAVGPADAPLWFAAAVEAGGGVIVPIEQADALLWFHGSCEDLAAHLARSSHLRWVQLSAAGIETYEAALDPRFLWTCAKRVYAEVVAEHALALGIAGLRGLRSYAMARAWTEKGGVNLFDAEVVVLGGGGIAEVLVQLLRPFRARTTILRRRPKKSFPGVDEVYDLSDLHKAIARADLVVLALALTPATEGVIGAAELEAMAPHAWLVNVARGRHVVTADLVEALTRGSIGGAALDVTDPEPLPENHPLWSLDNCLITPHTANAPDMHKRSLAAFTTAQVRRFAASEPLHGHVDVAEGY